MKKPFLFLAALGTLGIIALWVAHSVAIARPRVECAVHIDPLLKEFPAGSSAKGLEELTSKLDLYHTVYDFKTERVIDSNVEMNTVLETSQKAVMYFGNCEFFFMAFVRGEIDVENGKVTSSKLAEYWP